MTVKNKVTLSYNKGNYNSAFYFNSIIYFNIWL